MRTGRDLGGTKLEATAQDVNCPWERLSAVAAVPCWRVDTPLGEKTYSHRMHKMHRTGREFKITQRSGFPLCLLWPFAFEAWKELLSG